MPSMPASDNPSLPGRNQNYAGQHRSKFPSRQPTSMTYLRLFWSRGWKIKTGSRERTNKLKISEIWFVLEVSTRQSLGIGSYFFGSLRSASTLELLEFKPNMARWIAPVEWLTANEYHSMHVLKMLQLLRDSDSSLRNYCTSWRVDQYDCGFILTYAGLNSIIPLSAKSHVLTYVSPAFALKMHQHNGENKDANSNRSPERYEFIEGSFASI